MAQPIVPRNPPPTTNNDREDVDSFQRSQGSDQTTLETVVTIVTNLEREGSVHSNFAKYRTSPITFEDYFGKSGIQRLFVFRVLKFQVYLNFGAVCSSFLSTFITDQVWFWDAKDDLLHALLLHTLILSVIMLFIPFLTYKMQKWDPGAFMSKSVLEALVRVYQASLFTLWFAFGCGKIWRSKYNDLEISADSNLPLFFLPVTYYSLSTFNQIVILIFIRFTQMKICNRNAILISGAVSAGILMLTLPLILIGTAGRGFLLWETLQIIGSASCSAMESSLTLCSFKKYSMNPTASEDSDDRK